MDEIPVMKMVDENSLARSSDLQTKTPRVYESQSWNILLSFIFVFKVKRFRSWYLSLKVNDFITF